MAALTSLGVHKPTALSYLVDEGWLPPLPKSTQYQWTTYTTEHEGEDIDEEVLATSKVVVWSHGKFVRNVYRFDLEGEEVLQALLTRFPAKQWLTRDHATTISKPANTPGTRPETVPCQLLNRQDAKDQPDLNGRALVVLLKSKTHIYFLRGSHHIIDLPFEVERAFAAPRGIIIQRKRTSRSLSTSTPQIPKVPPNSFFTFQGQPQTTFRHSLSPSLHKSFAKTNFLQAKPYQPSPLSGISRLDAFSQEVIKPHDQADDDDFTNIYTLTGPLGDLGVVTFSLQHHKPRLPTKSAGGLSVEFEGLDPAEQVIYASAKDELPPSGAETRGELSLLATFNPDISTVTIWHAWYIEEKSLKELLKLRADQKAAKAKRRSSFPTASMGTGAATPATRRRDGTRESFAGAGALPGETHGAVLSRKPTKQEEEKVMASQMDPDYQPVASQQPVRESRRVSSMNADVRASQTTVNASFVGAGARRATSFGGPSTRRSLSHRKSRGSTPGSVHGHSQAGEDETMDLDDTLESESDESTEEILRHIRATVESPGMDSVFGCADDNFKRELVVRKIISFPVGLSTPSQGSATKSDKTLHVATMAQPHDDGPDVKIGVYVHDPQQGELQHISLRVRHRPLWPELSCSPIIAIPMVLAEQQVDHCQDMLKLTDCGVSAILLKDRGVILAEGDQSLGPVPDPVPYRVYNTFDLMSRNDTEQHDTGKNRTLDKLDGITYFKHAGSNASYDEVSQDAVHHRRRLHIRPSDPKVRHILAMCSRVLPKQSATSLPRIWCVAYARIHAAPEMLQNTTSSAEHVALVAALFTLVVSILDDKARALLSISKLAAGKGRSSGTEVARHRKFAHEWQTQIGPAWAWLPPTNESPSRRSPGSMERRKDQLLIIAAAVADDISLLLQEKPTTSLAVILAIKLMLVLDMAANEQKLQTLSLQGPHDSLLPVIAQLGLWLNVDAWSPTRAKQCDQWAFVKSTLTSFTSIAPFEQPVCVYEWFEESLESGSARPFASLSEIAAIGGEDFKRHVAPNKASALVPRLTALTTVLEATQGLSARPAYVVESMAQHGITQDMLETLPESIAAPFREAIARCEKDPSTSWAKNLLQLVGRAELVSDTRPRFSSSARSPLNIPGAARDVAAACNALDQPDIHGKTKEAARHAVSQLIFHEDRRLIEATGLMHFNSIQIAQCPKLPEWDENTHFEVQRKVMHFVTTRTVALPAGDGMIHYDSQMPLLTEKFHLPGFHTQCLMQPMGHTLTTDRTGLTEEKVSWAFFHAGVSVGLRISRHANGIDTSWIAFNKPNELTNRHAGMLLALGLSGHLRHLAKWLSFKYLTPKHSMTSIGLLLGLSASYLGSMDGLITRMLSVHITRMLPPGAAELNVSPATQTAGLMGIGLLYYNTSHRRMTEIMLSEIESMEIEDPDSGPDPLRDESYRLAAGFALGYINLAKGNNLSGLHGMQLSERLLAMAVGPRPVQAVHVFDRATAGAVIATALVFMKTGVRSIANKIDIPDTEAQYAHIRPDILMLRAMAKHLILWDDIEAKGQRDDGYAIWIDENMPSCCREQIMQTARDFSVTRTISSAHIPVFHIHTGLAFALGLRYAGTGNTKARDEILSVLKIFYRFDAAEAYYFDAKLGRSALKRCIDVLALSAATVMAGTGDLDTFRWLRRMHGRIDAETTYGSHLAAHLAIGMLFLGGGTFTFGTSNLAVASLIVAFYPLFPMDVQDNRVHLQAFRHFWVFAAEARCIVVEDIDTQRPIHMPIKVHLKNGTTRPMQAPCLLPELDSIASVQTDNSAYWPVTLDFAGNTRHLSQFRKDQRIFVRRCPASEAHDSVFTATFAALTDAVPTQAATSSQQIRAVLAKLPALKDLDRADFELLLPPDVHSSVYSDERSTVADDRLVFQRATGSDSRDALWNLRILFAWAEKAKSEGDGKMRWIGNEVVEALKAVVEERSRGVGN